LTSSKSIKHFFPSYGFGRFNTISEMGFLTFDLGSFITPGFLDSIVIGCIQAPPAFSPFREKRSKKK